MYQYALCQLHAPGLLRRSAVQSLQRRSAVQSIYIYILHLSHLADALIQSDLQIGAFTL